MERKQLKSPEELMQNFNKLLQQIKTCDEFIALSMRSGKLSEEFQELKSILNKTYETIVVGNEELLVEIEHLKSKYQSMMSRLQWQTYAILEYLQSDLSSQMAQRLQQQSIRAILGSHQALTVQATNMLQLSTPCMNKSLKNVAKTPNGSTIKKNSALELRKMASKMTLADYKASPLTKTTKLQCRPLTFLEFDAELKQEHFDKIPKYMRGREVLEGLKQFLEHIVIPCFNKKYQLLHRERSSIRNLNELDLWKVYNDQASLATGFYFITQGDISRQINKMLDKKMQNRLVMLRHIGLLQEKHISQTKCYIWNEKFI